MARRNHIGARIHKMAGGGEGFRGLSVVPHEYNVFLSTQSVSEPALKISFFRDSEKNCTDNAPIKDSFVG